MKIYLVGFICFSAVLFSCKEKKQAVIESKQIKKAIGKLVTDSVAPPLVTPIAPAKLITPTITSKPYSLDPLIGKEAITAITPANGLPVGYYGDVVQDKTGNLWLNNSYNIIKYDGHNFTTYPLPPGDYAFFKEIAICNNELWVVASKRGSTAEGSISDLFVFNGTFFERLPFMQSVVNQISGISLFPQPDRTIWASDDKQILKFEGRQLKQTITQKDLSFNWIYDIKTDRQGNTWFTDRNDSTISIYDGKTFKKLKKEGDLLKVGIRYTLPFSVDSIYISTDKGIYFFNGSKSTKLNDNIRSKMVLDKQGILWFNSFFLGGNLNKMSSAGISTIGKDDGLETEGWDFGLDRDDNIWITGDNIIKRLYKPVTTYGEIFPTSSSHQSFKDLFFDRQGKYWFGSFNNGISCYNGKNLINYSFSEKGTTNIVYTDNNIIDITQDNAGNIWISTAGKSLIKFDGKSFFLHNKSTGLAEDITYQPMHADSKGNIWYPRNFAGVACYNGKEKIEYTTAQGLCNNDVRSIFEDKAGTMWFGTSDGLSRLKNGRFTTFDIEDGLANKAINSIAEDEYGNLWLCTDGGISRFDGEQFINYFKEDGSFADAFRSIGKDTVNNLYWFRSVIGFTAMTIRANHPDSVVFENYSEAEGFPLIGFTYTVDKLGALWTGGTNNSLSRFDYKKVKENSKPFNLHITQIRLNNETICWSNLKNSDKDSLALPMEMQLRFGKLLPQAEMQQMATQFNGVGYDSIIPFDFIPYHLSLPYKANSISFDFAAIAPHFSISTRYQYRLEGFDNTWSPLNKNTNANFGNLREGSYVFKLKALNPYGIWSEMSYSFKVLPPWFRTWWAYTLYALLFVSGIYIFIRWRTKTLQKEKIVLEEKVKTRTSELNQSLQNLKATQSQLIQSEKMASLGELTAGIAHEIQNPLNFVNNFSEVNKELVDELKSELATGNVQTANEIADDIKDNSEKINHHGKRADAIVKGMLQHSRSSSGVKEPIGINALCDEYLRLAYHACLAGRQGLRAKDPQDAVHKDFNATMKTDFDESIGNINVVPQDMGRVILNLINNAFYAVDEKKKQQANGYEPTVTVSTKRNNGKVEIKVADNGKGIPQKVLDKIFQPFFTTKPTGQGTGLGLSLSYDIVKAHGGEIRVNTIENEGTEFIILLPIA